MLEKIKKTKVFEDFRKALKAARNRPLYMFYALLADLLFLFLYGFIVLGKAGIFTRILYNWQHILALVSRSSEQMLNTYALNSDFAAMLAVEPDIKINLMNLLWLYLILLLALYVIYCLCQGLSWKFSLELAGRKMRFYGFMKQFALVNILWFALFSIYHLLSLLADLRKSVLAKQGIEFSYFSLAVTALLFVISYFVFISYAFIGKHKTMAIIKRTFADGVKKFLNIAVAYMAFFAAVLVLNLLLAGAFMLHAILAYAVGILIVMPAFTVLRIFFISYMDRIDSK